MTTKFQNVYQVAWGDLDANRHLRNTAYLDYAAQTRILYLASQGFATEDFAHHHIGPIVFEDRISYHRELLLLENMTVKLLAGGLNPSGSKFILTNHIYREDGTLSASVVSRGAWFDLKARRVTEPPAALKAAMEALERDDPFEDL